MGEPKPRFSLDEVLRMLESGPARIAAATVAATPEELLEPLEPGGWSARDVLGHVRACNTTWGGYIERILDEDHPSFRAESPRATIDRTDVLHVAFRESLDAFTTERSALMSRLRAVPAEALARTGIVRLPGPSGGERSAFYYAHRMAEHERQHVRHLERSEMARRD